MAVTPGRAPPSAFNSLSHTSLRPCLVGCGSTDVPDRSGDPNRVFSEPCSCHANKEEKYVCSGSPANGVRGSGSINGPACFCLFYLLKKILLKKLRFGGNLSKGHYLQTFCRPPFWAHLCIINQQRDSHSPSIKVKTRFTALCILCSASLSGRFRGRQVFACGAKLEFP